MLYVARMQQEQLFRLLQSMCGQDFDEHVEMKTAPTGNSREWKVDLEVPPEWIPRLEDALNGGVLGPWQSMFQKEEA
ncbi:hypothetical protein ACFL2D_02380 [Patescibacteria group bacterium]